MIVTTILSCFILAMYLTRSQAEDAGIIRNPDQQKKMLEKKYGEYKQAKEGYLANPRDQSAQRRYREISRELHKAFFNKYRNNEDLEKAIESCL